MIRFLAEVTAMLGPFVAFVLFNGAFGWVTGFGFVAGSLTAIVAGILVHRYVVQPRFRDD